MNAAALLAPGLLDGRSLLIASAPDAPFGDAAEEAFVELGARVCRCQPDALDEGVCDEAVRSAVAELGAVEMLLLDGPALFSGAPGGLRGCLDAAWNITRAAVNHAFLPGGSGRVVYLAPPRDAGEHAEAAVAALENLARTLSIEWARHRINVLALAVPGPGVECEAGGVGEAEGAGEPEGAVAALAAYLASPAGDYFSGCLLDLSAGVQP